MAHLLLFMSMADDCSHPLVFISTAVSTSNVGKTGLVEIFSEPCTCAELTLTILNSGIVP